MARSVWIETYDALRERMSTLEIDRRALMLYCMSWQILADAQKAMKQKGRYLKHHSCFTRHPAAVDEVNAMSRISALTNHLGLSPRARKGVKVRTADADPLREFQQAKRQ